MRPRHRDATGLRKWCRRCILRWQRTLQGNPRVYAGTVDDRCRLDRVIPDHYRKASLLDLSPALREQIDRLPERKGLYLWGEPGRGKSHALCAIAGHLYATGLDVDRIAWELLLLRLRDTFKATSTETELDVIRPLIAVDVLIIEDVGTTVSLGCKETDFSLRTALVLLDQRIENNRPTFFSSNKNPAEIRQSFDARIASRIEGGCVVVKIDGPDRRQTDRQTPSRKQEAGRSGGSE